MQLQIVPLIIVAAYLVGMLIIGFVVGKLNIKDSSDYMLAGRRMGLFMVAFSLSANNIGGGSTTGLAQKAFGAWGMSAIWYVLAASIAMIPLAYFAPKIRKTMAVTIPEVVGRRFGKFSSTFTAVLGVLSLFCLTSSQIAASGTVVATLTGIPNLSPFTLLQVIGMGILFALLSSSLISSIFGTGELCIRALVLTSPVYLFCGINVFFSSYFTALSDGLSSAVISTLRSLIFVAAFIFILPLAIGGDGLWLTLAAADAATIPVTLFLYFRKGRVRKNSRGELVRAAD